MTVDTVAVKKKAKFFYGWVIVAVCFLGDFISSGVGMHSFGFILKPMTQELGWSRTETSLGASLRTVTGAFSSVIIGPALDRWGPRVLMILGALAAGIGIMAQSRMTEIWQFYLVYAVLGAVGMIAIGGLVTSSTVVKWFIRKRGRATAIVISGLPLGGSVLGPITQIIIQNYGWRTAFVVLGSLVLIIMIPSSALFMRKSPEDMGLLPDGDEAPYEQAKGNAKTARIATSSEENWTLKAALKTPTLWIIVISFILAGMGLSAGIFHQTAYISDKGLPASVLTLNIIVYGVSAAIGAIVWGLLGEKYPARYLVAASFFFSAGGLAILVFAKSLPTVLLYAGIYPLATSGSVVLEIVMLANYYGRNFIGTIRGAMTPFRLIATAGGPLFAGFIYDATKSYDLAFTIFAASYILATLVILVAKPPKAPKKVAEPEASGAAK